MDGIIAIGPEQLQLPAAGYVCRIDEFYRIKG